MANRLPLDGFLVASKRVDAGLTRRLRRNRTMELVLPNGSRPKERIRIELATTFPDTGLVTEVRERWDSGVRQWIAIEQRRRPDLDGKLGHRVLLPIYGDESREEIEETLAAALAPSRRELRPATDWQTINVNLDELRRHYSNNRSWFRSQGGNHG